MKSRIQNNHSFNNSLTRLHTEHSVDTDKQINFTFDGKQYLGYEGDTLASALLANGVNRPGEMVRKVEGLSTKVLNVCLKKNVDFGIMKKNSFNEIPPRVEYEVTPFGRKFIRILDELEKLQDEINAEL